MKEIYKKLKGLIPNWVILKGLENNPIVKSALIWFIVVPVCARIFGSLNDTLNFSYGGHDYAINLSLPFSWQIFFYSACAYAIGNLVVKLYCPSIIVDHDEYSSFKQSGKSWPQINGYLIALHYKNNKCTFKATSRELLDDYLSRFHTWKAPAYGNGEHRNYDQDTLIYLQDNRHGDDENQAFWYVHCSSDCCLFISRMIASIFYMIGFILFFIVAVQNVAFVISITSFF